MMSIYPNSKLIKWFCPQWIEAMATPFGLFFRGNVTQRLLRHETKHWEQMHKDGIVYFYCRYLCEYIKNIWVYKDTRLAYMAISYEREARRAERS